MFSAAVLLAAYCLIVLLPAGIAVSADRQLLSLSATALADLLGLTAIAILSLQFVLSARVRWIERPLGLDRMLRFHRAMAITALALLCGHPLLVAVGGYGWSVLLPLNAGWGVILGRCSLLALVVAALSSLYRVALKLRYEAWLVLHNTVAMLVLGGGLAHGWAVGPHCASVPMRSLLLVLAGVAAAAWLYRHVWRRACAARVTVLEVRQELHNVWTLRLALPSGAKPYDYLPGQFHFLRLRRACDRRSEEHPFTISSSPTDLSCVSSTIKASGDFTATIGATRPGDHAQLDGPFGRFSCVFHPAEKRLVFVAGGIGITPFASMLRHLRDSKAEAEVILFYANRAERDIALRGELEAMAAAGRPRLTVIHVLSDAGPEWKGERGRVTVDRIRAACGDLRPWSYYLCGPKPMMRGLASGLTRGGVPRRQVRYEDFAL